MLTEGAKKYDDNNWQNARTREEREKIFGSVMRHINAWRQGEVIDPEYGIDHLAHCITDLIFLAWHDQEDAIATERIENED